MIGLRNGIAVDISKTRVDKLGERLKESSRTEEDLILLDEYRQSFSEAYNTVFAAVSKALRERYAGIETTGRGAKSTGAIIDKLRRESIRLTQIQDIAGCRVVVPDILAQDEVVGFLVGPRMVVPETPTLADGEPLSNPEIKLQPTPPLFNDATVIDRRAQPSHGYRAVHIIVRVAGKPVEIQIRSRLQHLWAEHSEKFSDEIDPSIKYGGGDERVREYLAENSKVIAEIERLEKKYTVDMILREFADKTHESEYLTKLIELRSKVHKLKHKVSSTLEQRNQ